MNELEKLRARLAEIGVEVGGFSNRSLSTEEMNKVNALNTEFEQVTAQIESLEKIEEMTNKAQASAGRKTTPAQAAPVVTNIQDRILQDPKRGFKNQADFYAKVINSKNGHHDPTLVKAGLMEKFGEDGGYMVPEDFRLDIQKKVTGDESLLSRTQQFLTSSNTLILPTYETAPWDPNSGFQAYWEGEAKQLKASSAKWGETSLRLHKLTALVKITDELMEDAPLLESWINANAPEAMLHKVNSAIIGGDGVGKPLGLLNSGFKIAVAKEGSQAADSLVFENLNKMLGALTPASIGRAVWLVNPAILPLLRLTTFGTGGSNPVPAYLPSTGISGAPYGTLFGIPLMPMMGGVKAVGDQGDIILVDLKFYFTALKAAANGNNLGVKTSVSTHVYFDTDETALKFTMRMAGQVPYKAPITNEAGDFQASGIVTLADRA